VLMGVDGRMWTHQKNPLSVFRNTISLLLRHLRPSFMSSLRCLLRVSMILKISSRLPRSMALSNSSKSISTCSSVILSSPQCKYMGISSSESLVALCPWSWSCLSCCRSGCSLTFGFVSRGLSAVAEASTITSTDFPSTLKLYNKREREIVGAFG